MNDNIDKNEIRRAIDRLQIEHPCGIAYDPAAFVNMEAVNTIKDCVDKIDRRMMEDTEINIICEFAKLYLEGVRPTIIPKQEWIPCTERFPEENICDDGYVEPSDCVLVFGDHGNYGVSRYWGNRRTKKTNPDSFPDWMDLDWKAQKPIAWMPLPEPYKQEDEHGS